MNRFKCDERVSPFERLVELRDRSFEAQHHRASDKLVVPRSSYGWSEPLAKTEPPLHKEPQIRYLLLPASVGSSTISKPVCMASFDRLLRFKHYLDAIFLLFVEDFIAVGSLSQRKPVSYDVIKSNAILLEPGEQLVDISVDQRLTGMDC